MPAVTFGFFWGSGSRFQAIWVSHGLGFRVYGLGFRVEGLGFRGGVSVHTKDYLAKAGGSLTFSIIGGPCSGVSITVRVPVKVLGTPVVSFSSFSFGVSLLTLKLRKGYPYY